MHALLRPFILLGAWLFLLGCDRPFVDVRVPNLEILSPDTSAVLAEAEQILRVRATSFREVSQVLLNGEPMQAVDPDLWESAITLESGINRLVLTALDSEETPAIDTLRLVHLAARTELARTQWEEATGGHAISRLPGGSILISGGARLSQGPAEGAVFRFDQLTERVELLPEALFAGRAGHTMTAIGDGTYVVAGGSRDGIPTSVDDLMEVVERYDPGEGSRRMTVIGDPIRRAYHTAFIWQSASGPVLELLGGLGDVRYRPDSRFGVREDLRRFLVKGDTLEALVPAPGIFIDRLAGHIQIDLDRAPIGLPARFLITGSVFESGFTDRFSFIFDARDPSRIGFRDTRFPATARFGAAGELLTRGQVLRWGGISGIGGAPQASADLYVLELDRFLGIPLGNVPFSRAVQHGSATFVSPGRILLLGGFNSSGTVPSAVAYFVVDR